MLQWAVQGSGSQHGPEGPGKHGCYDLGTKSSFSKRHACCQGSPFCSAGIKGRGTAACTPEDSATGQGGGWGHLRPPSDSVPGAAHSAALLTCPRPAPPWGPLDLGPWRNHLRPCSGWPLGCQQDGGHQERPSPVGLPSVTMETRPRRCHLLSDPQSPHGRKSSPGRLAPLQRGKAAMVLEQAGRWGRRATGTRCN